MDFNMYLLFAVICVLHILILYIQQSFIIAQIPAFQFLQGTEMLLFRVIAGLKILGVPVFYGLRFLGGSFYSLDRLLYVGLQSELCQMLASEHDR